MKKVLSILLAGSMMLSCAACKKANNEGGEKDVPTLTWLVPGDKQADIDSVLAEVNKITEEKIGAKIDLQFIDAGAFSERMKMNMASGTDFDLCFTGWVNPYIQAVQNGGLLDITDMVKNNKELYGALPEYAWEAATVDGKIYAVPNLQIMATATGMVIQKDLADKYHLDASKIKSINDIEPFLEAVKNGEPNIYPYRPNYGTRPWWTAKWEKISSNIMIRRDGSSKELKMLRELPEFEEGVKKLREWYQKGYIRKDVLSVGDDTADYNAGKYAVSMTMTKPGAAEGYKASFGRDALIINIDEPYMTKEKCLATMTGIGLKSKNPEKALQFIQLINTDKELYNLVSFGIEGKHYTLNSEGKVHYIENSGYAPKSEWKFGNQFNALLTEGQSDTIYKETEDLNQNAQKSPLLEFVFDTTPVKSEISQVSTIISEYDVLNKGADDPNNYLNDYNTKMDSAGQAKIREEMQRQVDAFWK